MKEVLDCAERLADALGRSERYVNLRKAEKAVEADAGAKSLLEEFNRTTISIFEKQQSLKPIEPEEKLHMADLQEKVAAHPLLQELQRAQADYSEMMNKVNRLLFDKLDVKPA